MTDNLPAVFDPDSGEIVDLNSMATNDLVALHGRVGELMDEFAAARYVIVEQVAARMDRENTRTADVDGLRLTVNAPTRTDVDLFELRNVLEHLVSEGVLTQSAADKVIVMDKPRPPAPRVAKAELNKLLKHPDVGDALKAVSRTEPQRRTLKTEAAQ